MGRFNRKTSWPTVSGIRLAKTVAIPDTPPAAIRFPIKNRFIDSEYNTIPANVNSHLKYASRSGFFMRPLYA